MRRNRQALVVALVTFFLTTACYAQLGAAPLPQIKKKAGPTLEETTQWITQKFESISVVRMTGQGRLDTDEKTNIEFDGCKLSVIRESYLPAQSGLRAEFGYGAYYFDLQTIESEKIRVSSPFGTYAQVGLYRTGEVKSIRSMYLTYADRGQGRLSKAFLDSQMEILKSSQRDGREDFLLGGTRESLSRNGTYSVNFSVPDMETAQSAANAFKHAVALCQQKAAQEKAAEPAKPKSLF